VRADLRAGEAAPCRLHAATAEDLIGPTRAFYDGPLEVGHDLMMITIGERIEVETRSGAER
jgi:hypothetical protein